MINLESPVMCQISIKDKQLKALPLRVINQKWAQVISLSLSLCSVLFPCLTVKICICLKVAFWNLVSIPVSNSQLPASLPVVCVPNKELFSAFINNTESTTLGEGMKFLTDFYK